MAELFDMDGPGFYQGLRGRASGRLSPRTPVRPPRREVVYARHGLIDQGAADPNQGQLFDVSSIQQDVSDVAASKGLTPGYTAVRPSSGKGDLDLPLGGAPGFMPGLTRKQKVSAITSFGEATGSQTPMRDAMNKRQFLFDKGQNQPWYSGVDPETGEHDLSIQGDAPLAISAAASRQGVSEAAMTRAVAITSPRNRWAEGTRGQDDFSMPNIETAEGAMSIAQSLPPTATPAEIAKASVAVAGRGLPSTVEKAALTYRADKDNVSAPISVKGRSSQKTPNFEQSLNLSHPDQTARRIAAESYTVDTHDAQSVDVPEKYMDRVGMYDVTAMTGARTALKNFQLPANAQARLWESQRTVTQKSPLGPLFKENRKGSIVENPEMYSK